MNANLEPEKVVLLQTSIEGTKRKSKGRARGLGVEEVSKLDLEVQLKRIVSVCTDEREREREFGVCNEGMTVTFRGKRKVRC